MNSPSPAAVGGGEPLVECVFVVGRGNLCKVLGLQPSLVENCSSIYTVPFSPDLLFCHPAVGPAVLSPQIGAFCMPDGLLLNNGIDYSTSTASNHHSQQQQSAPTPTVFPFVLTSLDGSRKFVMCLTFWEPFTDQPQLDELFAVYNKIRGGTSDERPPPHQQPIFVPKCVCVMSRAPLFTFFRAWLCRFYDLVFRHHFLPEPLIASLVSLPLPPPDAPPLDITFGANEQAHLPLLAPPRATSSCSSSLPLLNLPLSVIFTKLSIPHVLHVIKCLMLSEKVLLVSKNITLLTCFCEGLSALLYPFRLYGPLVFIPVLPCGLTTCLESPTPFVIGMTNYSFRKLVASVPPDVTVVQIDCDMILPPASQQQPLPSFGDKYEEMLIDDLTKILEPDIALYDSLEWNPWDVQNQKKSISFNTEVRAAFLRFLCSLFHDHREYLLYQRILPSPCSVFDTNGFLKAHHSDASEFLSKFVETQLFMYFVEERPWPEADFFDVCVYKKVWTWPLKEVGLLIEPQSTQVPVSISIELVPSGRNYSSNVFSFDSSLLPPQETNITVFASTTTTATAPQPPSPKQQDKNSCTMLPEIPVIMATVCKTDTLPKQWFDTVETLFAHDEGMITSEASSYLINSLKQRVFRLEFCHFLLEKSSEKKQLKVTDKAWSLLGGLLLLVISECVTDYAVIAECLEVGDRYYKLDGGKELFLTTKIRSHEVWKDSRFWSFLFTMRIHNSLKRVYSSAVLDNWQHTDNKEKTMLAEAEWAHLQTQVVGIAVLMTNLTLPTAAIRHFTRDVCISAKVSVARESKLVSLVNCMPDWATVVAVPKEAVPTELTSASVVVVWVDERTAHATVSRTVTMTKLFTQKKLLRTPSGNHPNITPILSSSNISFTHIDSINDLKEWLYKYSTHVTDKLRIVVNRPHHNTTADANNSNNLETAERVVGLLRDDMKLGNIPIMLYTQSPPSRHSIALASPSSSSFTSSTNSMACGPAGSKYGMVFSTNDASVLSEFCAFGKVSSAATERSGIFALFT